MYVKCAANQVTIFQLFHCHWCFGFNPSVVSGTIHICGYIRRNQRFDNICPGHWGSCNYLQRGCSIISTSSSLTSTLDCQIKNKPGAWVLIHGTIDSILRWLGPHEVKSRLELSLTWGNSHVTQVEWPLRSPPARILGEIWKTLNNWRAITFHLQRYSSIHSYHSTTPLFDCHFQTLSMHPFTQMVRQ